MNKRTTDDWKALLDTQLPERLWVEQSDWDDEVWDVCVQHPKWGTRASIGSTHREDVAHLFAAAPEAVAEVVYLRRAFEAWVTNLEELSAEMKSQGYFPNSEQIDAVTAGIHHILEGHYDQ